MEYEIFDFRLEVPSSSIAIGSSMSGKSFRLLDIIWKRKSIFKKEINKVYYFYKNWQDQFDDIKLNDKNVVFTMNFRSIPKSHEELVMIIFDDWMLDFKFDDLS